MKKIIVLGGGTAGWITALVIQKAVPNCSVTLIESDEIGIVGAGEGTTPHFVSLLDYLNIPISELIKKADATIKNGIRFINWNGKASSPETASNEVFMHGFTPINAFSFGELNGLFEKYNLSYMLNVEHDVTPRAFDLVSMTSERNKVPFAYNANLALDKDAIFSYNNLANFGLHFDASEVAKVLRVIGMDRGIEVIEGKVVGVDANDNGNISKLILDNNLTVDLDFVFDCSGFGRVLIGKHFKAEWVSHSKYLPVNKAIPFFLPFKNPHETPPYTDAIAMKYGWMWKIPTLSRYGCGYVFDSNLISPEEAQKEIEEYLGHEITVPRVLNFDAGYFKTPRVNNCIAIGLSSGFIEPLEATSIWTSIEYLREALYNPSFLFENNPEDIENYNSVCVKLIEETVAFLYFHYMGERNDSVFWERFKKADSIPPLLEKVLNTWVKRIPLYRDFYNQAFNYSSWFQVGYGIGMINRPLIKKFVQDNELWRFNDLFFSLKEHQEQLSAGFPIHRQFLHQLRRLKDF